MKQRLFAITSAVALATAFSAISLGAFAQNGPMAGQKPTTTPSGLQYNDLKVGSGASPRQGDAVTVNYTGWLTNGKVFDSSVGPGKSPFTFQLGMGRVIAGWDEGVASMKVGGKRHLIIPSNLAYKDQAVGGGLIPPNSTLVFDVELLGINGK